MSKNEKSSLMSQRIKELRVKHNYTMEMLGKKIGVSKSTIAKWENGYVDNMRQDRVLALSKIFNVAPTYILGYGEDDSKDNKQKIFMENYALLSERDQDVINKMIETLLSKQE